MADKLGELFVEIVADTKKFDKGVDSAEKGTKKFKGGLDNLSGTVKKLLGAGALIAVAAKVADIGKAAIDAASKAEETRAKFETAFQGIQDDADAVAQNLAENYGLSTTESENLLGATGDLIKGFGASAEEALGTSDQIQKLSVDLASYNNLQGGATRASEILTKAFLGERDSLVSLGIKVSEADVKQRLLEKGQEDLTGQALLLAKGNATLELAIGQSNDAIGDFERTSEGYANQLRVASARTEDLQVQLGQFLLPAATTSVGIFNELTATITDYISAFNESQEIEKALKEGNATLEQKLSVLERQRDAEVENFLNMRKSTMAVRSAIIAKDQEIAGINSAIEKVKEEIAEKNALAEAEKKAADEKREQERQQREDKLQLQILTAQELEAINKIQEANKTDIEIIDEKIAKIQEFTTLDKEGLEAQAEAIEILQEEKRAILKEEEDARNKTVADESRAAAQILSDKADASLKAIELKEEEEAAKEEIRQKEIEAEKEKNRQIYNNAVGLAGSILQVATNLNQAELDAGKKTAQEAYETELAIFNASKALSLIEIGVNTAVEASKVLANPFLVGTVIAGGAAQAAAVLSSPPPPPPPQLATGAFISGSQRGSNVIVGEGGNDEEIFGMGSKGVPRRSRFANEVADIVAKKGGSQPIIINQNNMLNLSNEDNISKVAEILFDPLEREKQRRGVV